MAELFDILGNNGRGLPSRMALPGGIDLGVIVREGSQMTGAGSSTSNSAAAIAVGATVGAFSPPKGHMWYVETITATSALDILIWPQIGNGNLIANGLSTQIPGIACGPNYGPGILPINKFVREGESITFVIRTAVASGAGTDTLQLRVGASGHRVTNDLSFEKPNVWLAIGDSHTNTTGPANGTEFYHAQVARALNKVGKSYRRIAKGDGGWKSSHALIAMQTVGFDVAQADLITIMLGTNETVVADYQANIPPIMTYLQEMYPLSNKVLIGAPPRQDATEVSIQQPIRDWAASYVAGLGDPTVTYTSLAAAVDRTDSSLYLASDGAAGTRVHITGAGHTLLKNALLANWQANGLLAKL